MGYAVKAEYTLQIARQPRAFEYIGQRFFCTGFVLASRLDERALTALMDGWRSIDEITSNRIRFLFFIDNETTLIGWPHHPSFTESGYLRNNQTMLHAANRIGFTVSVERGAQVAAGKSGEFSRMIPFDRVRRLAQEMGLVALLPCLVWIADHAPKTLYARRLAKLDTEEILGGIRDFCDKFYDDNATVLSQIDAHEKSIDEMCRGLNLTINELRRLELFNRERESILRSIERMQEIPAPGRDAASYLVNYTAIARDACELAKTWDDKEFRSIVGRSVGWSRHMAQQVKELEAGALRNVPYLVQLITESTELIQSIPKGVPRSVPIEAAADSPVRDFALWLTEWSENAIAEEDLERDAAILRFQRYLGVNFGTRNADNPERISLPEKDTAITFATAYSLAFRIAATGAVVPPLAQLHQSLVQLVTTSVHSAVTSLWFHIYIALRDRLIFLHSALRRLQREGDGSVASFTNWQVEALRATQMVEALAENVRWDCLTQYEMHPLESMVSTSAFSEESQGRAGTNVVVDLEAEIRRCLIPIQQVMDAVASTRIPELEDHVNGFAQNAQNFYVVSSGGRLNVGTNMEIDMSNSAHFGDNANIGGDFTQAKTIEDSFNKTIENSFKRIEESGSGAELKHLLQLLVTQAQAVSGALSAEIKGEVAQDLELLTKEATKEKPRYQWLDTAAKGLEAAAKIAGAVGLPLIETLGKVMAMFA